MKNSKNLLSIIVIFFIAGIIAVACNKGIFNPIPLTPVDDNLYDPKEPENIVHNFKIYSWIRYNNTPGLTNYDQTNTKLIMNNSDLSAYGIHPLFIINPTWIFDNIPGPANNDINLTYGIINDYKFQGIGYALRHNILINMCS